MKQGKGNRLKGEERESKTKRKRTQKEKNGLKGGKREVK